MKIFLAFFALAFTLFFATGCTDKALDDKTITVKQGDLLLVIDMQNAYTSQGPWTCPNIEEASNNIVSLIESGSFEEIIFTRFDAPTDPIGTWKDYNEINKDVNQNEFLNEIVPQLEKYTEEYPVYSKSTYSSVSVEEVKKSIEDCRERGGSVVVTGVVSECCVLSTAMSVIDMGCPLVYLTDACAGCSDATEDAVVTVLSGLDYVQTTILSTEEYLRGTID